MELNKTVSNPMLVGAMQLIKADGKDPVPEHQALFMEQLDQAELLAPADVKGELDENGQIPADGKVLVRFPYLFGADGKKFVVVFTDNASLDKAKDVEGPSRLPDDYLKNCAVLKLSDLAKMVFVKNADGSENDTFGIVINPFMENIVIPRATIEQIARRKMEAAKAAMEKAAEKAGNIPDGQAIRFPGDKNNG